MVTAAECGDVKAVVRLLNGGANVNFDNHKALRLATFLGHTEVVRQLLLHGADVRAADALFLASSRGHTEVVRLLLIQALEDDNDKIPSLYDKWRRVGDP
jgi:ankyrin repeat protein